MDHPKQWLRYVEASNLSDSTLDFTTLNVRNPAGEDLGSVDGLIVDSEAGRPVYVVVDAGGWFKSRQFLVPIGEIQVSPARDALVISLSKEQIQRFPGFDTDRFDELSEADIKRINASIGEAYEPGVDYPDDEAYSAAWTRKSYAVPDWWNPQKAVQSPGQSTAARSTGGSTGGSTGRSTVESAFQTTAPSTAQSTSQSTVQRDRSVVQESAAPSPHYDGRAQPGDVLGVETEGERTSVGDTRDDEVKRRRSAVKDAEHAKG